jgi:hypothetical protein
MSVKAWSCGDISLELMNEIGPSLIDIIEEQVQIHVDKNVELAVRDYVKDGFLCIHEDRADMAVAFYSADPIEAIYEMSLIELLEKEMEFSLGEDETFETATFEPWDAETIAETNSTAEKEAFRSANLKKMRECWRILKAP